MKFSNQRLGKNVHWKMFSLLSTRCTTFFDLNMYRSAISGELRSFLCYIRALSFRQLSSKCPILSEEVLCLRRISKNEVNHFFSSQLNRYLLLRYSSSPAAVPFWCRCKGFIKSSSSSLHALIDSFEKVFNNSERTCDIVADYYEIFLKVLTLFILILILTLLQWYSIIRTKFFQLSITSLKTSLWILMSFQVICSTISILVVGLYSLGSSVYHFKTPFYLAHGKKLA